MGLRTEDNPNRPLGRLLKELPEGVAVPSAWLTESGISPQLVRKYVASGWLVPLAHAVYARPTAPVDWQGVVLGLQRLARKRVHVGGLSALNVQGLAHYLPLGGESRVHLWSHGSDPVRMPGWAAAIKLPQKLVVHAQSLFEKAAGA